MFGITNRKHLAFLEKKVELCYLNVELMKHILITRGVITEEELKELSEQKNLSDNLKSSGMKFFTRKLL